MLEKYMMGRSWVSLRASLLLTSALTAICLGPRVVSAFTVPARAVPLALTLGASVDTQESSMESDSMGDSQEPTPNESIMITVPPFAAEDDDSAPYPSSLHKIYVETMLSTEQAQKCVEIANQFASVSGRWNSPDSDRHSAYATCDFPVEDCAPLEKYLEETGFHDRLWGRLSELYGVDWEDMTYLDLFCAHYQAKDGSSDTQIDTVMDRLEEHRDGSLLSFSLLLSPPEDFEGGGTFYDALRDVEPTEDVASVLHPGGVIRPARAGDAVLHCGKILHGADVVTSGSRTVLVGFIDVSVFRRRPGALKKACTQFGRMDVAAYRFRRQESKGHKGWTLDNDMWISKDSVSCYRGFAPAFQGVIRRADPEFQRMRKLEAEDILLRTALRTDKEMEGVSRLEDITLL